MTGIERLRELAELRVVENRESATLRAELRSIADQIEREQDKVAKTDWDTVRKVSADMADRVFMSATIDELLRDWSRKLNNATDGHVASDSHEARAPFSRMRVLAVVTDMERHVLGHEGMEDSPVARWARELREALGRHCRDGEGDTVAGSPCDDLPDEDREAVAWVRDHGGLETVEARLMPEDTEWPRFEDGEPVRIGDEISRRDEGGVVNSIELQDGGYFTLHAADGAEDWIILQYFPGERVRRPAPKVYDADGAEIREGDTVWHVHDLDKFTVTNSNNGENLSVSCMGEDGKEYCCYPNGLTHRAPVPAADGKPLREGETVYDKDTGDRFEVDGFSDGYVMCTDIDACESDLEILPSQLTHERPDSLDKLAEDIGAMVVAWRSNRDLFDAQEAAAGCVGENTLGAALDGLVRRAKALAGDA